MRWKYLSNIQTNDLHIHTHLFNDEGTMGKLSINNLYKLSLFFKFYYNDYISKININL